MMTRLIAVALFALLAASHALGADLKQIDVPTGDLDLRTPAGQAELAARVTNAASTLCQPGWMTKTPDSEFAVRYNKEIYHACMARVTDRTMERVGIQLSLMK